MTTNHRIEVEDIGDVAVVTFVDRKILGAENIQMIGDDLIRLVDEEGRRRIVLDFSGVEFISSVLLGMFISLHRKVQAVHGKLVFCSVANDILDIFKITKLDRILWMAPTIQEALHQFDAA